MASILKVDQLQGIATAKTITVTVGASATQSLEQGLAKAWCVLDGAASTPAFDDSFNCASVADGGTGDYVITYTSNMASASHSTPMGVLDTAVTVRCNEGRTSSTVQIQPLNTSNSPVDEDGISMTAHGDSA
tara:strand:+ start:196 stop:591 length:396 start_codon:yes stop_codon:yes gene_type:complete